MKSKDNKSADSLSNLSISIDYGHTASATLENTETKFLRITDIQDGFVNWQTVPFCECSERERKRYELADGDIVFARTGATTGKSYLINNCPPKSVFASYLIRVRPNERINPRYLFQYFQTSDYWKQISSRSTGTAQAGVNASKLASLQIPLPPLPEQKRIAEVLDNADALREKRRLALQKLDTLLQSVFLEMFGDPVKNPKGWNVSNLGGICKRVTDGTHQPPKFTEKGIPFLFVSNIRQGIMSFTTNKFISEETYSELTRRCPIELDDILYTIVGSYGNAAVVKTTEKFAFQRHIAHIKPNLEIINSEFLLWMLLSEGVRRQVDKKVRGIAQQTLNLSEIKTLQIFCPPKILQEKFALVSKEINKLKTRAIKSEVFSGNLFQSLQQRAFKGELFKDNFASAEEPKEENVWQQTSLF